MAETTPVPILSGREEDVLIDAFMSALKKMLSVDKTDMPRGFGFVSLCLLNEINTDRYRRHRLDSPDFERRCAALETDLREVFGEVTVGRVLAKGRALDVIEMNDRVNPHQAKPEKPGVNILNIRMEGIPVAQAEVIAADAMARLPRIIEARQIGTDPSSALGGGD